MSDKTFVDGLAVSEKTFDNGGKITKVRFYLKDFIAFCEKHAKKSQDGKDVLDVDIKMSRNGKLYAELNDYQPQSQGGGFS